MQAIVLDMYGVIMVDAHGGLVPFVQSHFPAVTEDAVYAAWDALHLGGTSPYQFWKMLGFTQDTARIEALYLETIAIDKDFYAFAHATRGKYKLGLLSNDVSHWNAYLRQRFALNPLMDAITVSGDIGIAKPNPQIFAHMAEKLGVPPSACLLVDDAPYNVLAAQAAGMQSVLFARDAVPCGTNSVATFAQLAHYIGV